jgi:hypothetical protein
VRRAEEGRAEHAEQLEELQGEDGAQRAAHLAGALRADQDLQARLVERVGEVDDRLALGGDAQRTEGHVRAPFAHGVDHGRDGVDLHQLVVELRLLGDALPEVDAVADGRPVLLEDERLDGLGVDAQLVGGGGRRLQEEHCQRDETEDDAGHEAFDAGGRPASQAAARCRAPALVPSVRARAEHRDRATSLRAAAATAVGAGGSPYWHPAIQSCRRLADPASDRELATACSLLRGGEQCLAPRKLR